MTREQVLDVLKWLEEQGARVLIDGAFIPTAEQAMSYLFDDREQSCTGRHDDTEGADERHDERTD